MENVYLKIGEQCSDISRISVKIKSDVENKLNIVCMTLARPIRMNIYLPIQSNLINKHYEKY